MRLVWTVMFALASSAAFAASPEDDYIAARDKAIADIAAMESTNASVETLDAANEKARTDLEKRLTALLGPFTVKDFPAAGTINIESLSSSDVGFGMLDGLRHGTEDGPSIVAQAIQAQLGLKLDSKKMPVDTLVVDRIEKTPSDN